MALQGSGTISLQDLADEFDNTAPYSLDEFYRGGAEVPEATENANVPTSGAISLGDFYGATKRIRVDYTVSSNTDAGIDLKAIADANGYSAGITDVYVTVNSGVYVGSPSSGESYAIVADNFASGDIIHITNNGYIVGAGGVGGIGGSAIGSQARDSSAQSYQHGTAGGRGIYTTVATNITNNGTIAGGGGGGGSGGCCQARYGDFTGCGASGGGGGAGYQPALGGAGSNGANVGLPDGNYLAPDGGDATITTGGSGGVARTASGSQVGGVSGASGAGGNWGQAGANGSSSTVTYYDWWAQDGGTGGAAGHYLVGNSNVTWVATGTRLGQVA